MAGAVTLALVALVALVTLGAVASAIGVPVAIGAAIVPLTTGVVSRARRIPPVALESRFVRMGRVSFEAGALVLRLRWCF